MCTNINCQFICIGTPTTATTTTAAATTTIVVLPTATKEETAVCLNSERIIKHN